LVCNFCLDFKGIKLICVKSSSKVGASGAERLWRD
jgi:hypothetical protein